jgi:Mrp family chromosome partitioning ATPase
LNCFKFYSNIFQRSPHYNIKVISVASLIESKSNAIIYKGPRKTNLIKKILKETFWGKLDFLIFDTPPGTSLFNIHQLVFDILVI